MGLKPKACMFRVDKVLLVGMLSKSVEKQVKSFEVDEVKVVCESFTLSVATNETLVSNVSCIVSIDVNAFHANVMKCFYDVMDDQCALGYLRNNIFMQNMFSGKLS
jgi:hypothetical protein